MSSEPAESTPEARDGQQGSTEVASAVSESDLPLVVDRSFQFAILRRVGVYGLLGAVYVGAISLSTDSMADPLANWRTVLTKCLDEAVYIVPGLLVVIPLVTVNFLRLTRRYASPIDKLSQAMQLLSAGRSDAPLVFDNTDAWPHLATQFNELRDEILELRQTVLLQSHLSPASPAISQAAALPEIEIPDLSKEFADAMLPA